MPTEAAIITEGKIVSVLPGTMFRVEVANRHLLLAHLSGKMRKRFIRLTIGDRVKLEMSPYDFEKARIVCLSPVRAANSRGLFFFRFHLVPAPATLNASC